MVRTGFAVVGVGLCVSLCDLQVLLRDDLVERVSAAAELLAGVAMAAVRTFCQSLVPIHE